MILNDEGRLIERSIRQPRKQHFPMYLTPSGISISLSDVQSLNVVSRSSETFARRQTDNNDVHP